MRSCEQTKLPWKPQYADKYYYLEIAGLSVDEIRAIPTFWCNTTADNFRWRCGIVFRTEKEALEKREAYLNAFMKRTTESYVSLKGDGGLYE